MHSARPRCIVLVIRVTASLTLIVVWIISRPHLRVGLSNSVLAEKERNETLQSCLGLQNSVLLPFPRRIKTNEFVHSIHHAIRIIRLAMIFASYSVVKDQPCIPLAGSWHFACQTCRSTTEILVKVAHYRKRPSGTTEIPRF